MLNSDRNFELEILNIQKIKQLKTLRELESTARKLYKIKQNLNSNIGDVEIKEEKILNIIIKQLSILDEINTDINRLKIKRAFC